jgi:hypothetical protein
MVSPNEARFNLREIYPLSRNICIAGIKEPGYTGQRMNQKTYSCSTGYRDWLGHNTSPKVSLGKPEYPNDIRDTAKSGMGCEGNRRLNYLVEFIFVNVGGLLAEVSSPPMKRASVGGVIVLGARESRVHGEGRQGINISR